MAYIVHRLSSILAKRNLSPSKLDEIKIKVNILAQFVEKKVEDALNDTAEAAEAVFQKAKEDL